MGNSDSMTGIGEVELEWSFILHSAGVCSYPSLPWTGACSQALCIENIALYINDCQ